MTSSFDRAQNGSRMGLLGGTFDPVHLGHLTAARAAQEALQLDRVRFVPAARPPHRPDSPRASEYHRREMLRRAVAGTAGWEISDLELQRDGPSYTFDTLAAMHREGLSPLQLFFITGTDAFAEIATWHRYPEVLDSAHFAVISRPGVSLAALQARVPSLANRMIEPADVAASSSPRIILIESHTPEVSSTDIRRRASRGEPLDGLVPAEIAAYILRHGLYRSLAPVAPGT